MEQKTSKTSNYNYMIFSFRHYIYFYSKQNLKQIDNKNDHRFIESQHQS